MPCGEPTYIHHAFPRCSASSRARSILEYDLQRRRRINVIQKGEVVSSPLPLHDLHAAEPHSKHAGTGNYASHPATDKLAEEVDAPNNPLFLLNADSYWLFLMVPPLGSFMLLTLRR